MQRGIVLQRAGGVVDGVGEALGEDAVRLGGDVVLQGEHVSRGEQVSGLAGTGGGGWGLRGAGYCGLRGRGFGEIYGAGFEDALGAGF
jgi:hypothetical protein